MFSKLLRPLIKHCGGSGLRPIIRLDNVIVAINGEAAARFTNTHVRAKLARAGFIEHTPKCT